MDTVQLKIVNVSCVRQHKKIFSDISFELSKGEVLLIEGANGSGKSSLLRLLTGLAQPTEGDILWQGTSIYQLQSAFWQQLHYLGHTNGIKLGLTVLENLTLASRLTNSMASTEISVILTHLQLDTFQHTLAKHLSAGQKRKLALAKLLLLPKMLWVLDEPLTALDAESQTYFLSRLEQHLQHKGMAIVSSHHALPLADAHYLRLNTC